MKHIKKLLALVLSVLMVMSMSVTAFAANEGTAQNGPFEVTITNAEGHDYVIYQIFTGELAIDGAGKEVLSNVKYGADYLPGDATTDTEVPQSVLDAVKANPATAITLTGNGTAMTTTGDKATITVATAGYYMIEDVTPDLPDGEAPSAVIFQVVGKTTVASKHSTTTIVKKVQDINDSTGEQPKDGESVWIDSADYDINDTVPFKSTSNFSGLKEYDTYKVEFTDIMAKGLTYKGDMKVYVNGDDKTSAFTIASATYTSTDEYNGGTIITVTCDDIIALIGQDVNTAEIVLEYSATLNSFANLGEDGNPNKIKVKFSPNGEGDNETPWDVNIVFTYKVEANKYANKVATGNELTGAGFTLFKWIKDDSEAGGAWVQIGEEVTGEAMTKFEWKGLDDGKYKLEETTTPAGYNTIDPIEFEVVAQHVVVADNPTLTNLTGNVTTGDVTFTADKDAGSLSTDVVNKSGSILPETGGIGVTIFYALGGAMVLAAVVLLVTKRRMDTTK